VLYDSSHIELSMPYLKKSLENSLYLADNQKELTDMLRRMDLQQTPLGCDFTRILEGLCIFIRSMVLEITDTFLGTQDVADLKCRQQTSS